MSAALLREAANLMRERAKAAEDDVPGPWEAYQTLDAEPRICEVGRGVFGVVATPNLGLEDYGLRMAEHIASWHPVVALAVADWLDHEAIRWDESFAATQRPSRDIGEPPAVHFGDPSAAAANANHHARDALAVATGYLGRTA